MKKIILFSTAALVLLLITSCAEKRTYTPDEEALFSKAAENSIPVNEGFNRCVSFVDAWLDLRDSASGLIPRNINDSRSRDIWNAKDCAADNYPFMVLTSALLRRDLFDGVMMDMLEAETRLTSRIGSMPDTYSFSKQGFAESDTLLGEIIFGSAEYIKDGLIPLTEWLGPSPWSERMISIIDDIWKYAPVETPFGKICSDNPEVNGDMLQSLSRIYWTTGNRKYLEWAERLGDYYLLGSNHPTRNFSVLRLRDHGCEIVSGLCELYATVTYADPPKKESYREPVYEMLNRILEAGRNEDGLFYNSIDPVKGVPVNSGIADNFGYTLNGFYTVYLIDGIEKYREPVLKALEILNSKYRNYAWEGTSQDGYADAIEGALNLYVREPVAEAEEWINSEIRVLWGKQQPSGIIEGWHGDGNFARTTIMYCMWKTGGVYLSPWRDDLKIGGIWKGNSLYLSVSADTEWKGKIMFDRKRHSEYMNLPLDWPRINQFPEYFTAETDKSYSIAGLKKKEPEVPGAELLNGLPVRVRKGENLKIIVQGL
ncbi:MAG: hypothetical protein MUE74_06670 [Bacteroidales bacterium]|jgi:hypothetical protein|nr:hypothetical protein [Bacteroidales bacterium]